MTLLLIAVGGAAGSVSRYLVFSAVQRATQANFPFGTIAVNIAGSVLVGVLAGVAMNTQTHPWLRPALIVGFCGGFTTFSAFSMETVGLINGGEVGKAALYAAASLALCVAGAAIGFALSRPAGS
jgi:fluoride exporter